MNVVLVAPVKSAFVPPSVVAKKEVEVAFVRVVPPAASINSAVVVESPVEEVAMTRSGAL